MSLFHTGGTGDLGPVYGFQSMIDVSIPYWWYMGSGSCVRVSVYDWRLYSILVVQGIWVQCTGFSVWLMSVFHTGGTGDLGPVYGFQCMIDVSIPYWWHRGSWSSVLANYLCFIGCCYTSLTLGAYSWPSPSISGIAHAQFVEGLHFINHLRGNVVKACTQ